MECREKICALKEQIQTETRSGLKNSVNKGEEALRLVDEIAQCESICPEARSLMPQLRRSISDFYNPFFNRAWTVQFVLQDLEKMEKLFGLTEK